MNSKSIRIVLLFTTLLFCCSNSVEYSENFKNNTSGSYLYNQDDVIEIFYEKNKLKLKWREGVMTPVSIDTNEFFVADMYAKLYFVQHPQTKERYLSIMSEENEGHITYDYLKVPDTYKTPSTLLKEGDYEKALQGYFLIREKDSTSEFINEREFNRRGYRHIRKKEYDKAIGVLKLNAVLHPQSVNVYDSLAEAYLLKGDSLQAFKTYKKALEMNAGNNRAKKFIEAYSNMK